jgi:hypothetical protein
MFHPKRTIFYPQVKLPVRIWVRIGPPHPLVCRKRRLIQWRIQRFLKGGVHYYFWFSKGVSNLKMRYLNPFLANFPPFFKSFIHLFKSFYKEWNYFVRLKFFIIMIDNIFTVDMGRSAGDAYSSMVTDPTSDTFRCPCTPILWFVFPIGLMRLITVRYFCHLFKIMKYGQYLQNMVYLQNINDKDNAVQMQYLWCQ